MKQARNPDSSGGMARAVLVGRRVWVLRPFLTVHRNDIRQFLLASRIGWADDPSNDNDMFERVRVRKSRDKAAPHADFAALAEARRMLAGRSARFLEVNASLHGGRVGELDLEHLDVDDPAHIKTLLHLAALIGGRSHLAGRQTTARIVGFLKDRESRLAADRVVFDRRKGRLFLVRERRLLPDLIVPAGETAVWDNRFRIHSLGKHDVTISAPRPGVGLTPLLPGFDTGLPGAVHQLALQTGPVMAEGDIASVKIEPIIPQFNDFLPIDLFEIANVLAKLAGLAHFPLPPIR